MNNTQYIRGIDALRGLAIGMVLFNHLGVDTFFKRTDFFNNHLWHLFSGETGVRIFFVISGFIITHIIWSEKMQNGRFNLKRFFWRRFFRLFPAVFALGFSVLLLMIFGILKTDYFAVFCSVTYVYNYVPLVHYTNELAHTWSLGVEEQFYILWSVILLYVNKFNRLIYMCLFFCLLGVLLQTFSPDFWTSYEFRPRRFVLAMSGYIFVGCLIYFLVERYQQLWQNASGLLVFCIVLLCYISPLFFPTNWCYSALLIQSFGVAIFVGWISLNQKSILVSVLAWKPFVFIGKISYSLYIVQGLFLTTGPGSLLEFQRFPLNIILTFIGAVVLYFSVELPIRNWSRSKY